MPEARALRYLPSLIPPATFEPKRRDRAQLWLERQFDLFCRIAWAAQQGGELRERAADIRLIVGASGSGKTWYTKRAIRQHRGRVVVWDFKRDHHELRAVTLKELALEIGHAGDLMFVVEELPKVTRAGQAPPYWHSIVELGRAYGFTVVGTTQRAAYVDLGFRGAATFVRCGRQGEEDDARAMGKRLGVPYVELQRLPDHHAYVFDGRETKLEKPRFLRT